MKWTSYAISALALAAPFLMPEHGQTQQPQRPNILVIMGDDIGQSDISAYTFGLMGYHTPNIDRIATEGMKFTDYYAEQSCTAGRSSKLRCEPASRRSASQARGSGCNPRTSPSPKP